MFELKFDTSQAWVDAVLSDFNRFLIDHAAAERKASGMAMSMVTHYPDRPELMRKMADIAVEELQHFNQVLALMLERGIQPTPDVKDPYINQLQGQIRRGRDVFLLDRLIIGSIVEARGCERFQLIADHCDDPQLKAFYNGIAESESRHYLDFLELAERYFSVDTVQSRVEELLVAEAEIVKSLEIRAALH